MRRPTARQGARRAPYRPVVDSQEVDVPENEGPAELRTETAIAAMALLASRLFKRRAREIAKSYDELRARPLLEHPGDAVDRWTRQQFDVLTRDRNALVQPLVQRFTQFESQLNRQIDQQLRAIGIMMPEPRGLAATQAVQQAMIASRPPPTRQAVRRLEQSAKQVASAIERRLQVLVEGVGSVAAQAAIHGSTELPPIEFGTRTKTLVNATRRQTVNVVWTYQTGVQGDRYESAGVQYAEWRSQRDTRVRPKHKDRDGQVYDLKKGLDGSFPGREDMCRCYPIPKRPGYKP